MNGFAIGFLLGVVITLAGAAFLYWKYFKK